MADPRVQKMAEVVSRHSLGLRPGDRFLVLTAAGGMPLCREVFRAALAAGAHPYVRTTWSVLEETLLRHGTDEQLGFVHEFEPLELERLDARLVIRAEENLKALAGVDPTRLARQRAARRDLLNRLLERKGRGELRTCLTRFPTDSAAQEAGMSLGEYEDFVFNACLLDRPDPVQAWQDLSTGQQRYVDFLDTVGRVRIEGDGTELELSVAGRKWVNSDGRANFPSGEVFTGPVEDSAEGRISFDVPAVYGGRAVEGISLEFRGGMVVSARAKRGDEVLQALLGTDAGARRLGEFAFGLNHNISRATGDILFDEKIGGTIHLALGTAYPETGSLNRSAIHWDMMKDMRKGGRVLADGRPVYENGRFLT